MIRTSEKHDQFDAAFVVAQSKFEAAVKSNQNPAFRSKYADISSVIDATLEFLNAEGIGVRQHPMLEYKTVGEGVEAYVTVTTRLCHKSGEWEESDFSIPAVQRDRFDAQSVGSAVTYCCRYPLQSILCVRRQDDDGNAATGRGTVADQQAIAKDKIAKLEKAIGNKPNGQQPEQADQLTVVQIGQDEYHVAGDGLIMEAHKELLLSCGKRGKENNRPAQFVVMNSEGLNLFRHTFEEERKGILVPLKSTWAKA